MNQIINFPTKKDNDTESDSLNSIEDVDKLLTNVKRYHVEETINIIAEMIFHNLMLAGFIIESSDDAIHKDIFLAMESLKSMLLKYNNITHPLQKTADSLFERNEDGTYKLKVQDDTL